MKEIIVNVDNYNENSIKTIEGDNLSEVYKIYICKNKRRIDLTNKIAIMAYVNEYGNKKSNILALNITNASQGEIELPITNVISNENGVYACQIAIYGENNFLEQTAPFSLIVENNIFSKISNTAINSSDFHILSEAIKTTNSYAEKLQQGTENIELQYANKLNKLNSQLSDKANVDSVRCKDVKLTLEDMSDSVINAISGNTTVNVLSEPQDRSVTPNKTTFIKTGKNLFNKNDVIKDKGVVYSNGDLWNKTGAYTSNYIEIIGGETYVLSGTTEQLAFYDSEKVYISGLADGFTLKNTPVPSNAKYIRIMVANSAQLEKTQLEKGDIATTFEPFINTIDENIVNANTKIETERLIQSGLKNKTFAHIGTKLSKYGKVLSAGVSGQWDDGCVESPVIWFDENKKRYCMCYVGYKRVVENDKNINAKPQVGLAWSDDLLTWEKDSRNPIFGYTGITGDFDKEGTTGPYIHYENGVYYLYYIGLDEYGYEKGTKKLGLATSTDLYNWTRYSGNPIISPNGVGWSGSQIWHIHLVKEKEKYYMFFNASGFPVNEFGTPRERIGLATSTDLYNWTVDRATPLIDVGASEEWDSDQVFDPSIYKVNNIWYMAYAGAHSEKGKSKACDGMAWTTEEDFPYNWRKYSNNPILTPTAGFIDELYAHKPFIFQTQSCHYHYYTASTIGERCIALAYQNLAVSSRKTQTILCQEIDRTISETTLSPVDNSSFLFDVTGKKDLEFRIMIRGNLKGNTLQLSDASMSPGTVDTFTGSTWDNYVTRWRKVSLSGANPRYNYIKASVNADTATINIIVYEFRWNEE